MFGRSFGKLQINQIRYFKEHFVVVEGDISKFRLGRLVSDGRAFASAEVNTAEIGSHTLYSPQRTGLRLRRTAIMDPRRGLLEQGR